MGKESYHVLARLPDRGASEVFLARTGEGAAARLVVLERLPRARAVDPDVVGRFLETARVGSQLGHPNVSQIVDVGRLGSSYYVASEYADGELLRSIVEHARAQGKLQVPLRAVLTIAAGAVAGLQHAHERKDGDGKALHIVHGNLSPSRILVTRDGTIKLLDFGLPSAESPDAAELPYRSPEQVREETIDTRSDLFSLGAILWELLAREPLFKRGSSVDTLAAIESDKPAAPSTIRLDVPPELDTIVLKLLAKDPGERYQRADDVLVDIEALATKLGFQISTTDLSRMMRLWFGAKPDLSKLESDIVVAGMHLEAELAPGTPSPIDDLLDKVMTVTPTATPQAVADERSGRSTLIPGEGPEQPRESFEQIRDRILGARDNKDPKSPRAKAYTRPLGTPTTDDASASSAGPFGMSPTAITDVISRVTKASAAAGAATRESIARSAKVDVPDKVVVDLDAIADRPKTEDGTAGPAEEPAKAKADEAKGDDLKEAPRVTTPTARPASEPSTPTPASKPADVASEIAMARTQSTEWFERGEREAHEAHVRHAKGHHHDDHDDHKSAAARSAHDLDTHHTHRRPAWVIPVLGAAVVVLVVIAIVKMAGRETSAKPYGSNVAQARIDARVDNPVVADAAEVAMAGSGSAGSSELGSAQVAAAVPDAAAEPMVVDAAVVAVPVDAAQVAAVPVDAAQVVPVDAAKVAAAPVDAAAKVVPVDAAKVAVAPVDAAPKVDRAVKPDKTTKTDKTAKVDKTPKPDEKPASIEDLFAGGDFAKTNQACAKNTQFNSQILEMCATAACQVKDTALATRWLHAISRAARDPLIAKCKDLGVEINIP